MKKIKKAKYNIVQLPYFAFTSPQFYNGKLITKTTVRERPSKNTDDIMQKYSGDVVFWKKVTDGYVRGNECWVSSLGEVQNGKHGKAHKLVPKPEGYSQVKVKEIIGKEKKVIRKHKQLNHLILFAFGIKRPTKKHKFVHHIDGDPTNNNILNLMWVTSQENRLWQDKGRSNAKPQSKPVKGRKIGDLDWQTFDSASDAARQLNLDSGHISAVCRGKQKKTGEYEFEFGEPNEPPILPGEIWRRIRDTKAEISNLGRYKDFRGVIKTPIPSSDGYCRIRVSGKPDLVHRVQAEEFLGPPEPGEDVVNHWNGIKSDNRMQNTHRCSHSFNTWWDYCLKNLQKNFPKEEVDKFILEIHKQNALSQNIT